MTSLSNASMPTWQSVYIVTMMNGSGHSLQSGSGWPPQGRQRNGLSKEEHVLLYIERDYSGHNYKLTVEREIMTNISIQSIFITKPVCFTNLSSAS